MLIRVAATNAMPVALLSPKPVLSLQTKPSLPPSSRQTDLHRHLPCNVALKSSTLSSAQSGRRSSSYSTSSEHSTDAKSPTGSALCPSRLRRHSEPTPSLTPLKQFFNLDYSLPPFAPEESNAAKTDTVLSMAAATPNCHSEDLSPAVSTRTSRVKARVKHFEALQG